MRSSLSCATVFLALTLGQPAHAQRAADPLAGLDKYVEKALKDWNVPGISIAVVRNDSVILAKGYGVRRAGDTARVDAETIFAIGSNSKAFTTAAMAMLVDEKKLSWSEPVTRYLPWFQLADPWITRNLDLKDLVSHRSGVARHDALWYGTGISREELVRRQRFVGTERPFRTSWLYNNNMYVTAGLVIQQVSGKNWDDFVTERILRPLGMSRSSTTVRGSRDHGRTSRRRTWSGRRDPRGPVPQHRQRGAGRLDQRERARHGAVDPVPDRLRPPGC
jgi:CubicO group peptidase (beta-lactamase class C family)